MTVFPPILILCLLCVASFRTQTSRADDQATTTDQVEFFEREVRPLLVKHYYECHSVNAERFEDKYHTRPSTAIRHDDGHTLVCCTHGNRVVDFDHDGKIAWTLTNDDLRGD
ncbi:hypothetical protein AB1L42_23325 [Thalassoglobus sp. JC818]|uniref:hypothetical protein n=1 Tax=Thalassoglobus sp. JC818 TaxID=3232136 RepID=UPI0034577D59